MVVNWDTNRLGERIRFNAGTGLQLNIPNAF